MTASYGRNAVPTRLCRGEAARMTSRITGTSVNWGCLIRPIILLFGVTATDPVTFGVVGLLLASVAAVACWIPARHATNVSPIVALRHE